LTDSISYYDQNAEQFFHDTVGVNMEPLYQPFLALVPAGGSILDAGCGSGETPCISFIADSMLKPSMPQRKCVLVLRS